MSHRERTATAMRIRIVGAGAMGRGIAQWAATAGHTVELCDVRAEAVTAAVDFVRSMLERAVQKGRMAAEDSAATLERLIPLDDPWAQGPDVELVVEAVREDLDTKTEVFGRLEKALPATAVFATNTSSLSVTRIAAALEDPTRLAGLHFFNPVPLMKIVEIVPGAATRPEIPCGPHRTRRELRPPRGHRRRHPRLPRQPRRARAGDRGARAAGGDGRRSGGHRPDRP